MLSAPSNSPGCVQPERNRCFLYYFTLYSSAPRRRRCTLCAPARTQPRAPPHCRGLRIPPRQEPAGRTRHMANTGSTPPSSAGAGPGPASLPSPGTAPTSPPAGALGHRQLPSAGPGSAGRRQKATLTAGPLADGPRCRSAGTAAAPRGRGPGGRPRASGELVPGPAAAAAPAALTPLSLHLSLARERRTAMRPVPPPPPR